jgi:excisionase family DNA binding protein
MMDLLSLRQAARELHIAERTLRCAVRAGELPVYLFGTRTQRVDRAELQQWVQAKRNRPWHAESR